MSKGVGPPTADAPLNPNAARDHLANERTLLAWVRTSLGIMGMGFVVARFGLVLRDITPVARHELPREASTIFGTALILVAAVLSVIATVEYLRRGQAIERNRYHQSSALVLALAAGIVLVALLLAVYLLATT